MLSKRHSRDKQYSHLTLQHMLYAAPRLLQLVPNQDLKAVFFTSRGLRQYVQDYCTRGICFTATVAGLPSLIDQQWPPLLAQKLGIFGDEDAPVLDRSLYALAGAQWPKLAVLSLSNPYLEADQMQILASAHLPSVTAVKMAGIWLLDDAIKQLVKAYWPRLEMLDLSCEQQSAGCDASKAADLVKGEWPLLKTLDVSGNQVTIGQLLNGNWPALQDLTLLKLFQDEDVPTAVKKTSGLAWPSLKRLSLSDGAVDDMGMAELTLAEWPCLEYVCLDGVSAETVIKIFASCEWPALSHLELQHIYSAHQDDVMCTRLSQAHLPVLEKLVICDCCAIRAAGMAQLVQANWRNLRVLSISCCALDSEAVSELSKGQWPLLQSLYVCEFQVHLWPTTNVTHLLDGAWPVLSQLVLSPSDCEAAAFLLSGSSSTELHDTAPDSDYQFYHFYPVKRVRKTVTGRGPDHWPCLKFSAFVIFWSF